MLQSIDILYIYRKDIETTEEETYKMKKKSEHKPQLQQRQAATKQPIKTR